MTRPVVIFGAGGLAADIVDILARLGGFEVVGFVADRPATAEPPLPGVPVHAWPEHAQRLVGLSAVSAIGSPGRRSLVEAAEARGVRFLTVVDPSAQLFPSAIIGEGCVIGAGAIVAARARLGRHVYLNRAVTIGHHVEIGDFASLHAAVNVGGFCRIGAGVEIGIGATLVDRVALGDGASIGAGSLVTRDCAAEAHMVGVPARAIARP